MRALDADLVERQRWKGTTREGAGRLIPGSPSAKRDTPTVAGAVAPVARFEEAPTLRTAGATGCAEAPVVDWRASVWVTVASRPICKTFPFNALWLAPTTRADSTAKHAAKTSSRTRGPSIVVTKLVAIHTAAVLIMRDGGLNPKSALAPE
jgi:hypothetical protein